MDDSRSVVHTTAKILCYFNGELIRGLLAAALIGEQKKNTLVYSLINCVGKDKL